MFGASVQERQLPSGTTTKPHFLGKVQGFRQRGEMTFYRQGWRDGTLVGNPEVALKVPFDFPLAYKGNAFDFSRDLSTFVYTQPGGQHDLYLLSKGR